MNFYEITKKFEDVLLDLGYYRDWNYNYLCFYICNTKCFYIDYNHSKFGYKNCVENDSFTEYEYAFYTTEENIKNFLETIQQKAANFIKFIKKEQAINTKLKELENDFEPSMWSKFVNCVHKLLRNLWSLLNKQDTWYLIALFPLFGALIYTGYYIFNMCFAFFSSL